MTQYNARLVIGISPAKNSTRVRSIAKNAVVTTTAYSTKVRAIAKSALQLTISVEVPVNTRPTIGQIFPRGMK